MTARGRAALFALIAIILAVAASVITATSASGSVSVDTAPASTSAGATTGGFAVESRRDGGDESADTTKSTVVIRTDDCGAPQSGPGLIVNDPECRYATNECAGHPTTSPTGQPYEVISTEIQNPAGIWIQGPVDCTAPAAAPPTLPETAIHDAFTKVLPKPTIATAPPTTRALVNVETLIWLTTTKTVDLGTTPLLGHQINLIATVQTVTWNFGDNHTDTTTGPGRPFTTTDHCPTTTCPNWYGHTYTTTGTMTLTATITWTGRYNIDNGPYNPITDTVTTTPPTTPLQIQQSRAVLVPNPNETN